jgi:hypothetical protein
MSKVLQTLFVTVMATSSKTLREMVTPRVKEMSTVLQTPFVTVMVTSSKTLREMVTPRVKVTPLLEVHCPGRHTVQGSTHQHLRTQHLMTVHLLQMPERCRRGKSRGAVRVK